MVIAFSWSVWLAVRSVSSSRSAAAARSVASLAVFLSAAMAFLPASPISGSPVAGGGGGVRSGAGLTGVVWAGIAPAAAGIAPAGVGSGI